MTINERNNWLTNNGFDSNVFNHEILKRVIHLLVLEKADKTVTLSDINNYLVTCNKYDELNINLIKLNKLDSNYEGLNKHNMIEEEIAALVLTSKNKLPDPPASSLLFCLDKL